MAEYALQVIPDAKTSDQFRWLLLELDGRTSSYHASQASDCGFDNWSDALNDGTLALAQATHHDEYENEATDPVGNADCATGAVGAAYASHQDPDVGSRSPGRSGSGLREGMPGPQQDSDWYGDTPRSGEGT
jgi:hypothetical protein